MQVGNSGALLLSGCHKFRSESSALNRLVRTRGHGRVYALGAVVAR